jgi:beta-lactamase regulating signal transducer with metallopeptidase domain
MTLKIPNSSDLIGVVFDHAPLMIDASQDAARQDAYRRGFTMIALVTILGLILVMMLAMIVVLRRSSRRKQARSKPKSIEHVDAWSEAGRRFDDSIVEIEVDDDSDLDQDDDDRHDDQQDNDSTRFF